MKSPFQTTREKFLAVILIILWALLYLPHLRTNPGWYGDEGEWMEKCWTLIHGTPRVGPITNDFIFPYPYPPLYMFVTGSLLRVFGNDLVVARALGSFTALVAMGILFWIGTRLKDKAFGFLCAAGFLVYPEAVINFRWVRSHPMAGTLALACCGFMIRYVQLKRDRDLVWAGIMCSLATATNYFTIPLIAAVIITALFVNWRRSWIAVATTGAYGVLFFAWYILFQPDGISQLLEHTHLLTGMTGDAVGGPLATIVKIYRNIVTLGLLTPAVGANGTQYVDLWLIMATLGIVFFPISQFRKWLWFWLIALLLVVFKKLDNVPIFFYPATIFLPLLSIGFASALLQLGKLTRRIPKHPQDLPTRAIVYGLTLSGFALISLGGAWLGFRTKIDFWTQRSAAPAEAVMAFVNSNTSSDDVVIVPKQIYWMVKHAKKSMLSHCVSYTGETNAAWPILIPKDLFWFDSRWEKAKYIVLAYGLDSNGQPYGIDAIYTAGLNGVKEILESIQKEQWPTVAQHGEYVVLANPRFMQSAKIF